MRSNAQSDIRNTLTQCIWTFSRKSLLRIPGEWWTTLEYEIVNSPPCTRCRNPGALHSNTPEPRHNSAVHRPSIGCDSIFKVHLDSGVICGSVVRNSSDIRACH